MNLWLQIGLAVAASLALFVAAAWLVARVLHLTGVKAQLAATLLRLFPTVILALGVAFSGWHHRVALLFTVGATYFAAALVDGIWKFRNREAAGCPAR